MKRKPKPTRDDVVLWAWEMLDHCSIRPYADWHKWDRDIYDMLEAWAKEIREKKVTA